MLRRMTRKHASQVARVARHSPDYDMDHRDFQIGLSGAVSGDPLERGTVYVHRREVCGFVLYQEYPDCIHIQSLTVHPAWRRKGIGTLLAQSVSDMVQVHAVQEATICPTERNLPAHLFLKSLGWSCVGTIPEYYEEMAEPVGVYMFRFRLGVPANRITKYLQTE